MIYESIKTLPAVLWFEIIEEGDITYLDTEEKEKYDLKTLNETWNAIYDEWLDKHGIANGAEDYINKRARIAILKADLIITGKPHLRTMIKIEELKLKSGDQTTQPAFSVNLAKLGMRYGYFLDQRTLTTDEYYSHLFNAIDGKV